MNLASDNAGPVHPRVMAALMRANEGHAPGYGADALTGAAVALVREVLGAPEAAVCLVGTGTAANALLLATLARPWEAVFCAEAAHINEDECGAPEFFTGGAKLMAVPTPDGRMAPETLRAAIAAEEKRGVHGVQRGPVSLSQATENGTVYGLDALHTLAGVAKDFGLPVHMDGARFANALVRLGATPSAASWQAGVDALSLGGTKNGLMGVEAAVIFDPAKARELELRRKRGGHLFSKHRFLAAQIVAWLEDGLWLELAAAANARAARLAEGLGRIAGVRLVHPPEANIVFAEWPRALHRHLQAEGARYYLWNGTLEGPDDEPLVARLVTDWSLDEAEVERFLKLLGG